jgi:aspartokinase-like uncharacterized kinase
MNMKNTDSAAGAANSQSLVWATDVEGVLERLDRLLREVDVVLLSRADVESLRSALARLCVSSGWSIVGFPSEVGDD